MTISNDFTIVIPHDWSGEEALLVVHLLEQVTQSIWNLHSDGMMAAMRRRNAASGAVTYHPPDSDDFPLWTPPVALDEE